MSGVMHGLNRAMERHLSDQICAVASQPNKQGDRTLRHPDRNPVARGPDSSELRGLAISRNQNAAISTPTEHKERVICTVGIVCACTTQSQTWLAVV